MSLAHHMRVRFILLTILATGCAPEETTEPTSPSSQQSNLSKGERCATHGDCAVDEYCQQAFGACGSSDGYCAELPTADCPSSGEPVCGCDGVSYPSRCEAAAAMESIRSAGTCDQKPSSPSPSESATCGGAVCGASEFCLFGVGACNAESGDGGTCTPLNAVCTSSLSPVCGCDGVTYSSRCEAHARGTSILHTGACSS